MEVDSADVPAETNHTEAGSAKSKAARVEGPDSTAKKKGRLSDLPSPTADRPTRERKSIERLIISPDKEVKEFRILKGTGTALKEIPNIVFKLSKRRGTDEAVQTLHKVLFGKTSKHAGKANILKFSGFVWSGNEEKEKSKVKERLERVVKETLFQMSDLLDLNLSKGLKKEEGVLKVLEFLESPHKTSDKLVEEKVKKGKKAKKKVVKGAKKGRTPAKSPKDKKKTPRKKQVSDEEDEADEAAAAATDDTMEEAEDVDDEMGDKSDDDYNEKKKKSSTRKRKRKSVEKSRQESEDEEEILPKKSKVPKERKEATPKPKKAEKPKSKTAKVKEPSDEELREAITELLQNADFSKVTFTDVMKQLGEKFKVDLNHKKSHLKALIQEEIARLVGEADNEDEVSNSEGNEDEEKPGDEEKDQPEKNEEEKSVEENVHMDSGKSSPKDEEDGDGIVEDIDHGVEDEKGADAVEDADQDMNGNDNNVEDDVLENQTVEVKEGNEEDEG